MGRQLRPRHQVGGGGEPVHVEPDLGNDDLRGAFGDTGDLIEALHSGEPTGIGIVLDRHIADGVGRSIVAVGWSGFGVATAASKTDTFLGERYRRLVRRRGKQRVLVAVARSILVIVWHLLTDPDARVHRSRLRLLHQAPRDSDRKTRDLVRQLQALGHAITLAPAA